MYTHTDTYFDTHIHVSHLKGKVCMCVRETEIQCVCVCVRAQTQRYEGNLWGGKILGAHSREILSHCPLFLPSPVVSEFEGKKAREPEPCLCSSRAAWSRAT
jgi:hypothetical protein